MTLPDRPDARWKLVGARPCLDFVNTVGGRVAAPGRRPGARAAERITRDDIPDYDSLLRWSVFASLVAPREAARLRDQARRSPSRRRSRAAARAKLPRGPLSHRQALIEARPPREADLRLLERELREARRHQRLVPRRGRLESEWVSDRPRLDRMLWSIALSAASVLRIGRREAAQAMRRRPLRLAVPRHDAKPQPPVVPHGRLRQRREGAALPAPPAQAGAPPLLDARLVHASRNRA